MLKMFYLLNYENDDLRLCDFNSYSDCLNYAESYNSFFDLTIDEIKTIEENKIIEDNKSEKD